MFYNYITVALRNFYRFRFYALVNIAGLTVGLAVCLIILLYIRFELSYDRFNEHADRIVRIDWDLNMNGVRTYNAAVTPPVAETLVRDFPEVEAAARFRYNGSCQFKRDIENVVEPGVVWADNDVFRIFTIPFIHGNPASALKDPNSMVISESFAARFFPNENPVGKSLLRDNTTLYTITGVVKDLPVNSHFHYKIFLPMEGLEESKNGNWIGGPYNTYLLLRPGTDPEALEAKLPGVIDKYLLPNAEAILGSSFMDKFKSGTNRLVFHVRPLTDIHLHSHLRNELEANGDINYVYLFAAIAGFTLVIACINFINLATARSARRAREVGIRKVMGSNRWQLALQFIGESTMYSLVAFILALGLTDLALPMFNSVTGLQITAPIDNLSFVMTLTLAATAVGILAGIYPGIVLSSFQPVTVLRGKRTGNASSFFRSGLVIFQFAISIFLIIGTFALSRQLEYMKSQKLGFDKEQVIVLRDFRNISAPDVIRNEIVNTPGIRSGTISSYYPGPGSARNTPLMWRYGSQPLPENSINGEKWLVDYDYIETLGIQITEGRNFSRDFPSDSSAVILNESAVARLGLIGKAIGQKISLFRQGDDGAQDPNKLETWEVIGVIKDFNFESLRQSVTPLGLFFGKSTGGLAVRYDARDTRQVLNALEQKWKTLVPGEPFNYAFLDENFESSYRAESRASNLFAAFSVIAMLIACLGLFALTAYTAEQRTKEIGIRKVMGASVYSILMLLSRDFGKLIVAGFFLAVPIAAFAISWYLEDYAYKASIGLWIYLLAGGLTFMLAMITMGYQSLLAATANPVDSLRSE